jgi:hypothetical protein
VTHQQRWAEETSSPLGLFGLDREVDISGGLCIGWSVSKYRGCKPEKPLHFVSVLVKEQKA